MSLNIEFKWVDITIILTEKSFDYSSTKRQPFPLIPSSTVHFIYNLRPPKSQTQTIVSNREWVPCTLRGHPSSD